MNQVGTLLRGAVAYVGGDTSITHLAAAVEIAVIALFGPINPRYFGPWPPSEIAVVPYANRGDAQRAGRVVVLQGSMPCVPCDRAGCDDHNDSTSLCLLTMAPSRVVEQVDRIVAAREASAEGQ